MSYVRGGPRRSPAKKNALASFGENRYASRMMPYRKVYTILIAGIVLFVAATAQHVFAQPRSPAELADTIPLETLTTVKFGLLPPTPVPPVVASQASPTPVPVTAVTVPAVTAPVTPVASSTQPSSPQVAASPMHAVIYRAPANKLSEVADKVRKQAAGSPQIHVVTEKPTANPAAGATLAKVFVLAPETFHEHLQKTLVASGELQRRPDNAPREPNQTVLQIVNAPPRPLPAPTASQGDANAARDFYSPRTPPEKIMAVLQSLLGTRLVTLSPETSQYTVEKNGVKRQASLRWSQNPQGLVVTGDAVVTAQIVALVRMIDQDKPAIGRERKFIRVDANLLTVERLLEINRAESESEARKRDEALRTSPHRPIQQMNYLLQDGGGGDAGGGGGAGTGGAGDGNSAGGNRDGSNLDVASSLNYEVLDALDVVVIDATGNDVARVVDMIRQIEALSKVAEPQIEVYFLKHVHCIPLSGLIAQLYSPRIGYFQMKQGMASIIPLITPNAILIVGWGNAKEAMRDLIETLDQGVDAPGSSLRIFRLKYISATQMYQSLQGIFPLPSAEGSGFAPRLQVWADLRTNSLIVQAGENDFAKLEYLIAQLDVSSVEGGPTLQVRQIKLLNSYVNDVATALTEAITPGIQGTPDRKLPSLEMYVVDEKGKQLLRSGILSDVRIGRDVRNNILILAAPESSMPLLEELVKMLDAPAATAEIKVFQMQYGNAESLVKMLQTLLPTQTAGQVGPKLPGAKDADTLVAIRFAVDPRTNSIIAAGTAGDLKIVESLLLFIDREGVMRHQQSIYKLKNLRADAVAASVMKYIASHRAILRETPGVTEYEQLDSSVIVIPEATSNSLIISATPETYEQIMQLIQDLDQSPPQVMIQVLIAEVTLGQHDEFGAEFGIQDSLLFDRSSFSNITKGTRTTTKPDGSVVTEDIILNGDAKPGFGFNLDPASSVGTGFNTLSAGAAGTVLPQLLSNFATGRTSSEAGFGGLVLSANSNALSIMIRALQEKSCLEVLSRPQITAMNNQKAFIHVGQKVPVIKGSAVSGNSSFATQQIEYEDVGLLLIVTPNISPDGKVVMQVAANKSSLASSSDSVVVDVKDGKEIRAQKINSILTMTVVSAADNETVVLGGLISKEHQETRRRVPYLSDIPLLGKLFQYKVDRSRRTELLVILTPRIIRNSADAANLKRIEAARMSWCLTRVTELASDAGFYDVAAPQQPVVGRVPTAYPQPIMSPDTPPAPSPKPAIPR
ncbi:MAG: secretin N-terminal domain-containing protein [Thermoguttaceae bacterium]